ncbi:MAG: hypothetical protein ACI9OS_002661, partial [Ulvibacter sp.]
LFLIVAQHGRFDWHKITGICNQCLHKVGAVTSTTVIAHKIIKNKYEDLFHYLFDYSDFDPEWIWTKLF